MSSRTIVYVLFESALVQITTLWAGFQQSSLTPEMLSQNTMTPRCCCAVTLSSWLALALYLSKETTWSDSILILTVGMQSALCSTALTLSNSCFSKIIIPYTHTHTHQQFHKSNFTSTTPLGFPLHFQHLLSMYPVTIFHLPIHFSSHATKRVAD